MIVGGDGRRGQRSGGASALIQLDFCLCALHRVSFLVPIKQKVAAAIHKNPEPKYGLLGVALPRGFVMPAALSVCYPSGRHINFGALSNARLQRICQSNLPTTPSLAKLHPLSVVGTLGEYNIEFHPQVGLVIFLKGFDQKCPNETAPFGSHASRNITTPHRASSRTAVPVPQAAPREMLP